MKLSLKDIGIIAVASIVSFPVMYFAMLFATGNASIVFRNVPGSEILKEQFKTMRSSPSHDSLLVRQSQAYLATLQEKKAVEEQRKRLLKQQERIGLTNDELKRSQETLDHYRKELEQLVSQSSELERKKIRQLAKIYAAMRANEAAQILETLDDDLCIKIIESMNDDRQKGKILSSLSEGKAGRLSKRMGYGSRR